VVFVLYRTAQEHQLVASHTSQLLDSGSIDCPTVVLKPGIGVMTSFPPYGRDSSSLSTTVMPVKSAISARSRVPAREAMPSPSAATDNRGSVLARCALEVPFFCLSNRIGCTEDHQMSGVFTSDLVLSSGRDRRRSGDLTVSGAPAPRVVPR
jgi:hypothetical protein